MEYLGLKDSSRDSQLNCVISLFFYLHLMFHACVQKFDGMDGKFLGGELNRALLLLLLSVTLVRERIIQSPISDL